MFLYCAAKDISHLLLFRVLQDSRLMARCCGIAHLHLLDRRGAEEDLCLQTVAVCEARDTIKFSFHSHFSRTREGPDPKAEFLKQEMFQVT